MTERAKEVRLLALVPAEMHSRIRRQLAPLGVTVDFVDRATGLSQLELSETCYQVALVPAVLPEAEWWSLWGEIVSLDPRPEIIVYAHTASFTLWSGVLEMGGYDIIVEPFTEKKLQGAVLRAAQSFAESHREEKDTE